MKKYILAALALPALLSFASAETYKIDQSHSAVAFKVAHLGISKVDGRFDKFTGSMDYVPGKPALWKAEASIETASINTNEPKRDAHLRSPDFFDTDKYPLMTFKSTKFAAVKGMKGKMHGELTLHGVTKPVVMDVEASGPVTDPWGNARMAATAKTSVNRKDFGLVWNKVLDSGGLLVGEKVDITLELEFVQDKPAGK